MTTLVLTVHVLSVILTIGPITAAASMFPAATRSVLDRAGDTGQLVMLHRICRVYSAAAIAVPASGAVAAVRLHVWDQAWLITAIVLTVAAAAALLGLVLPAQRDILAGLPPAPAGSRSADGAPRASFLEAASKLQSAPREVTRRLAASTGGFNLLWLAVAVLMLVRPGAPAGS